VSSRNSSGENPQGLGFDYSMRERSDEVTKGLTRHNASMLARHNRSSPGDAEQGKDILNEHFLALAATSVDRQARDAPVTGGCHAHNPVPRVRATLHMVNRPRVGSNVERVNTWKGPELCFDAMPLKCGTSIESILNPAVALIEIPRRL
jgi:hypothetical protein